MSELNHQLTRREFLKLASGSTGAALLKPIDVPPNWDNFWGSWEYKNLLYRHIVRPEDLGGKEKYDQSLGSGLGVATLHGHENHMTGALVNQWRMLRNRINYGEIKEEDLTATQKWFRNFGDNEGVGVLKSVVRSQSNLTPRAALKSDQIVGLAATRSPKDQLHRYCVYGVDQAYDSGSARFIGVVLVADAPRKSDWDSLLSSKKYTIGGWRKSSWIADFSENIFTQLPVGESGKKAVEPRPGVLMVHEDIVWAVGK